MSDCLDIVVVSLFDGLSGGRIALDRTPHLNVLRYYSSEIDKYAIQVANKNYPQDVPYRLGSIIDIDGTKLLEDIKKEFPDARILLIGGSPCQGFSVAGKGLNFNDPRSKLFFEYVRILKELNPDYFMLENVKMKKEIADAIDETLNVKRVFINSKDFTGHIRKRYYWTNIPIFNFKEKDIKLSEIIDDSIPYDKDLNFLLDRTVYKPTISRDGIITINPKNKNNKQTWQRGRVYDINGRCPTICASLFDLNITKDHKRYRKLTINECEKLQGVPKDYTAGVPKNERGKLLGNGWTIDVAAHIFNHIIKE